MPQTAELTWSDEASICRGCNRPFRFSEDAITIVMQDAGVGRADAIHGIDFCLGCVQGESPAGEYDTLGYYGWLWRQDRHRWVIVFCWKRNASQRSQQRETGVSFPTSKEAENYVARLNRAIASARRKHA